MYPTEYYMTDTGKVWGRLPSGGIEEYDTPEDYKKAFAEDENAIYDGLAEQEEISGSLELPEDF